MTVYRFANEGRINGVLYVTVLDAEWNPIEYNVESERAASEYGMEV